MLDATNLNLIPDSKYDFIISSHCLEHIANPLKAIEEWIRVIKKGGFILLLLPDKDYCFDHDRPITEFSHLIEDFQNNTTEDDLTHLNEILELDDWKMHLDSRTFEEFRKKSLNNYENRSLHHHVFDLALLTEIFNNFRLEVILTYERQKYYNACHNIILGRKNFD
jgi:ubiquinone/menaquinone biosynthesis C-methylase UbiE